MDSLHCVYKHTFPNGKVYIGQTRTGDHEHRWQNGNGYHDQKVYAAIKEFGWDNIGHEIVADLLTQEEADNLEIELIKQYDATMDGGYNVALGGHNNNRIHHESGLFLHVLKYCGYSSFRDYLETNGISKKPTRGDYEGLNLCVSMIDQKAYSRVKGHSFSRNYPDIPINKKRAAIMLKYAFEIFCVVGPYEKIYEDVGELTNEQYEMVYDEVDEVIDKAFSAFSVIN